MSRWFKDKQVSLLHWLLPTTARTQPFFPLPHLLRLSVEYNTWEIYHWNFAVVRGADDTSFHWKHPVILMPSVFCAHKISLHFFEEMVDVLIEYMPYFLH